MNLGERIKKMNLGERIKKIREEKGIKQKELADKIGISYVMLSQYERGERKPKYEMIDRIANALDIDPFYLMYGENHPINEFFSKNQKILLADIENADLITEKISAVLKSFEVNNIKYTITNQTGKHNYVLEVKVIWNNSFLILDTDDLVEIYNKAQNSFNNSVKNIIDILSTYKKQGD